MGLHMVYIFHFSNYFLNIFYYFLNINKNSQINPPNNKIVINKSNPYLLLYAFVFFLNFKYSNKFFVFIIYIYIYLFYFIVFVLNCHPRNQKGLLPWTMVYRQHLKRFWLMHLQFLIYSQ